MNMSASKIELQSFKAKDVLCFVLVLFFIVTNIFLSGVEGSDICNYIYFHTKTHHLSQFHYNHGTEVKSMCVQCSSAKKGI